MCELFGADVREVLPAIGADHRIGSPSSIRSRLGRFVFRQDVSALISAAQEYGYPTLDAGATVEINQAQRSAAIRKLQRELHSLKGRRIALLGLYSKAGEPMTSGMRRPRHRQAAADCRSHGSAFDPVVKTLPGEFEAVRLADDVYLRRRTGRCRRGGDGVAGVPPHRSGGTTPRHAGRSHRRWPQLPAGGEPTDRD